MKKILITLAAVLALASCQMDFYSSDTMTSTMLGENAGAAVYTTDGVYSLFKDVLEYQGSEYSANMYVRHLLLMSELRGDNVFVTFASSDEFFDVYTYSEDPTCQNLGYFWWCAYRIIYGANSNIESLQEGVSADTDHLLGENYFIRAIAHLHLSTLYSRPYSRGRDNLGVVLRTSTDCSVTERATVGQVYDQIVEDLKTAMRLMKDGTLRGTNRSYANYYAAAGLLTRVYLYMGENQLCVDLADELLGSTPEANLEQGYDNIYNYFSNARTSKETLWCVAKSITDNVYSAGSQVGSMYYVPILWYTSGGTPKNADGWGEFSWSEKLMNVFDRYPQDYRYQAYLYKYGNTDMDGNKIDKKRIYFPVETVSKRETTGEEFRTQMPVDGDNVVYNEADDTYTFTFSGSTYTVKSKMVFKDKVWYVEEAPHASCPKDEDGHVRVFVRDYVLNNQKGYPGLMMRKFAEQDGEPQLCSPVMIRWAEVILNRAEANAKLGNDAAAIADVNVLRKRAGLPEEAMFTATNYGDWGYSRVLDVVLEERNLELCFEGHRAIDLYRNDLPIDRRYPGLQNYEVLSLDYLDTNFPLYIPFNEVSVSGIQQNK